MLVTVLLIALCAIAHAASDPRIQYHCIDLHGRVQACPENGRPKFVGEQPVAYVKWAQRINETGWAEMELVTNERLEDSVQAYYAGYLEGFVTARLIKSLRSSMLQENQNDLCQQLSGFIDQNLRATVDKVRRNQHSDPYWNSVGLSLYQIAGIDDGYTDKMRIDSGNSGNGAMNVTPHLSVQPCGVLLMNLNPAISDIKSIINKPKRIGQRDTHCSAIVKLSSSGDILTAHNTWSDFNTMLRIMKKMTLNYRASTAKSIVMSSYPGTIFSIDDFYITSTRLAILETTNQNFKPKLWDGINATNMVFEFIRNTVANRLAESGEEWAKIFSRYNGGTYNNQFMIVDYKRHQRESGKIELGLLTVLEQMPSLIVYADKSDHLRRHTYWASYNVPYFDDIFNISGYAERQNIYGDYYSHDKTARAKIFARDHHKAKNVSTLFSLMRYNDFKHDEFSRCNCTPPYSAELTIAARCDLNEQNGTYPLSTFGFRSEAAIDAKVTSSALVERLQMVAVSGPSAENVPVFSWANTKLRNVPHNDQPIEWNFKPILTTWDRSDDVFADFVFDF